MESSDFSVESVRTAAEEARWQAISELEQAFAEGCVDEGELHAAYLEIEYDYSIASGSVTYYQMMRRYND